ncbi:hypothetical protein LSTR_LSTR015690 [Laodelphax striatellus]|uniref:Uncharacterized protein n=1 Tax=Laodelphax striatellus TaxID=195883 RepID=A0A482XJN7_LAOST|nr:hypothetical protein LSTR_LSTR015690 [Laodelphax striatellus]
MVLRGLRWCCRRQEPLSFTHVVPCSVGAVALCDKDMMKKRREVYTKDSEAERKQPKLKRPRRHDAVALEIRFETALEGTNQRPHSRIDGACRQTFEASSSANTQP